MGADSLRINDKNCPVGDFEFCAITGTGILNEKASTRKKDAHEYKTVLELDEDKAAPLLDIIDDFLDENAIKDADLVGIPYQTHEDYEGIPKGKVWLRAKALTEYEDKKTGEIKDTVINVYDAAGNKVELPEGKGVGKGSTGITIGNLVMWDRGDEYGATLWLSGIQIGDYVPYEYGDTPAAMEGGSFKGFNTPQLQKDEEPADNSRRRSRREEPADNSRRRSRRDRS